MDEDPDRFRADRPQLWEELTGPLEAVMVTADPSRAMDNRQDVAQWCGGAVTDLGDVTVPTGDRWTLLAGPGEFVVRTPAGFTVVPGPQWRARRGPTGQKAGQQ